MIRLWFSQQSDLRTAACREEALADDAANQLDVAASISRRPSEYELQSALHFLSASLQTQAEGRNRQANPNQPWVDLAHSILNMKEFIYVR